MTANSTDPSLSVVLCTYNPRADYLQRVIDGLKAQTLPRERWELVVVDNNSTKPLRATTGPLASGSASSTAQRDDRTTGTEFTGIDLGWHADARVVVETQQGLSHARRRGFEEAKGDLIVNLDDDAVLDPDYLEQAVKLAAKFPFIGAFGCQLRSEFEVAPQWPVADYYGSQRTVPEDIWSNDREQFSSTPAGAGSVVRRSVARSYVAKMSADPRWGLLGRSAEKWLSCEDIEIAMVACDLGLGKGVFRCLNLTHLIPASKMTDEFQCKNAYGNGYSSVVHNYLRFGRVPQEPRIFSKLDRLYRLWRMTPRKRREESAKGNGIRDGGRFVAGLRKSEQAAD